MISVVPGLEVPIRHSTHGFGHNIYYHPNKISFKINGRKSVSTHQSVDKPFLISKLLEAGSCINHKQASVICCVLHFASSAAASIVRQGTVK